MIVCHCNVLSRAAILAVIGQPHATPPRSPAQVQKCLGCSPQCGRCAGSVREILIEAGLVGCTSGCASCPGHTPEPANDEAPALIPMIAAE